MCGSSLGVFFSSSSSQFFDFFFSYFPLANLSYGPSLSISPFSLSPYFFLKFFFFFPSFFPKENQNHPLLKPFNILTFLSFPSFSPCSFPKFLFFLPFFFPKKNHNHPFPKPLNISLNPKDPSS